MTFHSVRSQLTAAVCCALLAFAGGCQSRDAAESAAEDGEGSNSGVKSLPALHVVLAWESRMNGENWEKKNYQAKVEACRSSGMPFEPLSAQDQARLGTGEVEVMIDARRQFARQTSWTLGAQGEDAQSACLIKLQEHRDQQQIEDASGMYLAIDADTRAQDRKNMQSIGWEAKGEDQVKGQSCTRWQNDRQEVCMWSGGTKWGFSDAPADAAGCTIDGASAYLESIPLEAKPLDGGTGCLLEVKSFSLGKGLIPSNAPVAVEQGKENAG